MRVGIAAATVLATIGLLPVTAVAEEGRPGPEVSTGRRAPLVAESTSHKLSVDRYYKRAEIVRRRVDGAEFAVFVAEPALLESGVKLAFDVRSVAESGTVLRWRCVARTDVAECLGVPLRLRYLPHDSEIVMTVSVLPDLPDARKAERIELFAAR